MFTSKRGRTVDVLTFSIAKVFVTAKARLQWTVRRENHAYATGEGTWIEKEARKTRTKNMVREYVRQKLAVKAGVLADIDYHKVGMAYRKDQAIPEAQAKLLLRKKVIQDMVAEEMRKILDAEGIDDKYVIDKLKKAIQIAEDVSDAGNMIRGAQYFGKLRDMEPKEQKLLPPGVPDEGYLERLLKQAEEPDAKRIEGGPAETAVYVEEEPVVPVRSEGGSGPGVQGGS